jgi:hypothetical protein
LSVSGANRLPDTTLSSVQNGVLSSITYPTSGKTNFTYELNEYTNLFGNDQYNAIDTSTTIYSGTWGDPYNQHNTSISFDLNENRSLIFILNTTLF